MYAKAKKTISHVTPERPLTDEEKTMKVMQFLQQKRETFAVNILCNMVQSEIDNLISNSSAPTAIVKMAVNMADQLIKELYPMEEEGHED